MDWEQNPWEKKKFSNTEQLFRQGQEKLKQILPDPFKNNKFIIIGIFILLSIGFVLMQGIHTIKEDEKGVVLRFGKWVKTENPGLNFCLYPFEVYQKVPVMRVNQIESGFRRGRGDWDSNDETLILTGDENILDVNFTVQWRIKDVRQYLFGIRNPDATIKSAAEAAVREIIGQSGRAYAQTEGRNEINKKAQKLLQNLMDQYEMGVEIIDLQLQKVDAPSPVADAFLDVQRARADQERLRYEAEGYQNRIRHEAQGEANQVLQEAEGYKESKILIAQGEAARFEQLRHQYKQAASGDVFKERLYQEMMQNVLKPAKKIIVDSKGSMPYLLPFNADVKR